MNKWNGWFNVNETATTTKFTKTHVVIIGQHAVVKSGQLTLNWAKQSIILHNDMD